jgi:hypothetical protein
MFRPELFLPQYFQYSLIFGYDDDNDDEDNTAFGGPP